MKQKDIDLFIESWGSMGVLWGINRSMARVHALILVSKEPIDLDYVASKLQISRGNASMSLKELRNWRVIKKVNKAGDRRDFYEAEADAWTMFFNIATERKKREFDPALSALKEIVKKADTEEFKEVHARLSQMAELLATADRFIDNFLQNNQKARTIMDFLFSKGGGG